MKVTLSEYAPRGQVYFLDPSTALMIPVKEELKEPCAVLNPIDAKNHPKLVADLERKPFPHKYS